MNNSLGHISPATHPNWWRKSGNWFINFYSGVLGSNLVLLWHGWERMLNFPCNIISDPLPLADIFYLGAEQRYQQYSQTWSEDQHSSIVFGRFFPIYRTQFGLVAAWLGKNHLNSQGNIISDPFSDMSVQFAVNGSRVF